MDIVYDRQQRQHCYEVPYVDGPMKGETTVLPREMQNNLTIVVSPHVDTEDWEKGIRYIYVLIAGEWHYQGNQNGR